MPPITVVVDSDVCSNVALANSSWLTCLLPPGQRKWLLSVVIAILLRCWLEALCARLGKLVPLECSSSQHFRCLVSLNASSFVQLLSYHIPMVDVVTSVGGCQRAANSSIQLVNCPRLGGANITLSGSNFVRCFLSRFPLKLFVFEGTCWSACVHRRQSVRECCAANRRSRASTADMHDSIWQSTGRVSSSTAKRRRTVKSARSHDWIHAM